MGIKEEITKIAVEQGYDGAKPKSIAQAIDALTDTLAGEDVKSGRSVVDAIRKYAPYVGTGGGGAERVELFNETATTKVDSRGFNKATLSYNNKIMDDPLHVVFDGVEYDLPRLSNGSYGMVDGSVPNLLTYPLYIQKTIGAWVVHTETAGTHTIAAYVAPTPMPKLGSLQNWPMSTTKQPEVGQKEDTLSGKYLAATLTIGNMTVVDFVQWHSWESLIASGIVVTLWPESSTTYRGAYLVETEDGSATDITNVRDISDMVTPSEIDGSVSFTMPELGLNSFLYLYVEQRLS